MVLKRIKEQKGASTRYRYQIRLVQKLASDGLSFSQDNPDTSGGPIAVL